MFKKSEETIMLYLAFVAAGLNPDWRLLINFDWELQWVFEYGYFTTGRFVFNKTSSFKQVAKVACKEGWKVNFIRFYSASGYFESWGKLGYKYTVDNDPPTTDFWACELSKNGEEMTVYVYE